MSLLFNIVKFKKNGNDAYPQEIPYTTSEIKVGTWINGKPLYRKVIEVGALKNNGDKPISLSSDMVPRLFFGYISNGTYSMLLPITGANPVSIYFDDRTGQHNIIIQTTSDRTSFNQNYIILYYTKTTD